ncbi:carbohydrate ABC transporter permease [Streptomyces pristinaespiralis]|jgi:N,N'-diacetylchitobiose transport system permease protein|uniref:Sugar transporter membrane protein n=2 Tax=Streptomyces pristinaespiralis TaxID=38300 RepID=B5HHN0_STRE2|nr:sugar ABC transporter permease [Streptomyces pristinaespiralis]ALC19044.1 sugar transporter membrane protein [Streptomyces pristinaespiralis]EDY66311.1 sugar transporter membrane protein [Streptomyces pristinaespiralis ATCC 25486]QMU17858.1 sugar ABC transporter permease [Streptomyces pristinaespiralis]
MRSSPRALWPYLLIAPTVLGAAVLLAYPLARNLLISFQQYGMGELIRGDAVFTGLDNYREILGDAEFWEVVRRTLWWTTVNVVLIMVLGTLVALMLQRLGRRMRVLVLSGLVLAWASPVIATTTVFQWLFSSRLGLVNRVLAGIGFDSFEGYSWLAHGPAAFTLLVLLVVWQSVPFVAVTLHAALATVPAELFESARIDGAGGGRIFWSVTLPVLRPVFGLILCLEVIWVFRCFAQIWAVTRGGPGGATTTLPVYAYQVAQSLHRYDLGAAVATLTVLMLVAALIFYFRQMFKQEAEQ